MIFISKVCHFNIDILKIIQDVRFARHKNSVEKISISSNGKENPIKIRINVGRD
jgi:hypothetical protein